MVGTTEYAVPLGDCINVEEELQKLEADLKYQEGFLMSVMKKLSNEKFVNGAPAQVVVNEQNKKATADIIINPIPRNYGLVTWNGSVLTVS